MWVDIFHTQPHDPKAVRNLKGRVMRIQTQEEEQAAIEESKAIWDKVTAFLSVAQQIKQNKESLA